MTNLLIGCRAIITSDNDDDVEGVIVNVDRNNGGSCIAWILLEDQTVRRYYINNDSFKLHPEDSNMIFSLGKNPLAKKSIINKDAARFEMMDLEA